MTDRVTERQETIRQHRWTVDSVSPPVQSGRCFDIGACAKSLAEKSVKEIVRETPAPVSMPPRKQIDRPSSTRLFPTIFILALLCALTLEAGSAVAFAILTGTPLSYAETHATQALIAGGAKTVDTSALTGGGEGKMTQFMVNPYTGYVRKGDDPNAVPGQDIVLGKKPVITAPSADTAIVGIFGGSVAEQFSAVGSGALKRLLGGDPRFSGKKLEIVTAAMAGYKQPQQLLALNYLLSLGQRFDMIVNIDGFNEIAGPTTANMPKNVSPYFPTGWYHLADRLPDTAMLEKIGSIAVWKEKRKALAHTMLGNPVLRWSATAQFLWKGMDGMMAARESEARIALAKASATEDDATLDRGLPYAYTSDQQLIKDLVANWERSSALMQELASARGIPYLHFLQPNQYVAGSKRFTGQEVKVAVNQYSPYKPWVERGYPLLADAGKRLREQGVDFHDLSAIFKSVPVTVYNDDCCHMNREGNDLMAQAVATAVANMPLHPAGTFAVR